MAQNLPSQVPKPIKFTDVALAERRYISKWRETAHRAEKLELTGLALSGGGIRSAVFCLGVIQALAKHDVLKRFDYLSTVSGGGYIGSSLTWFTRSAAATSGINPQTLPYGTLPNDLPYGIDDPGQLPPKQQSGTLLLRHLRRHGSYLNPGGGLSILGGVAVVLRGLALNLLVIWLPIITAAFVALRLGYRWIAYATARGGYVWLRPLTFSGVVATVFIIIAILYSLYSGFRTRIHKDMPYVLRKIFERVGPFLVGSCAILLIFGTFPYARDFLLGSFLSKGVVGTIMTITGTALGLWSRLFLKGTAAHAAPAWVGPIGAALMAYGIGLLAYSMSDMFVEKGALTLDNGSVIVVGCLLGVAVIVGYCTDLNETTLHRFYRDRLMEAFMPDTDSNGDPTKGHKAKVANTAALCDMCNESAAKGPYHLINCHLVLTSVNPNIPQEEYDRWRLRGGDSFVFAPLFSGGKAAGWHETATNKTLSKISLATAMAASGAAVNPDAASSGVGLQRNKLFAMLMALLNIRLGYCLPNPKKYANRRHAPAPNHFDAGLAGVADRLSRDSRFFELTDGGNFENLGVYELLRRRVKTILICDATADPKSAFADLQNLLSRAESDFGATIEFAPPPLKPLMSVLTPGQFPRGVPFASAPFVEGVIRYRDGQNGTIYYIKPAIFAGLRLHVLGFKGASPDFPDDSTANQFFDEARFEAYRELGFACVEDLIDQQKNPGIFQKLSTM